MNLRKNLVSYLTLSSELDLAKIKLWEETKAPSKFKIADLEVIQNGIDNYLCRKAAIKASKRLAKQLKKLENTTLVVLKKINFPQKKIIELHDERYGKLTFWHKGGKIYFLKQNSDH